MGSVLLRGRVGLRGVVHSATGVKLLPTTVGLLSAARTAAVASVAGQLLGLEGELQSAPSATLPRTKRPPHGHQGLVLGTLVHSSAADYLRSQARASTWGNNCLEARAATMAQAPSSGRSQRSLQG